MGAEGEPLDGRGVEGCVEGRGDAGGAVGGCAPPRWRPIELRFAACRMAVRKYGIITAMAKKRFILYVRRVQRFTVFCAVMAFGQWEPQEMKSAAELCAICTSGSLLEH